MATSLVLGGVMEGHMGLSDLALDKLRVLHVILHVNQTNGQYNEHCLPLLGVRDISVCTYFEPEIEPPRDLRLFAGDGSLSTFLKQLRVAVTSEQHDVVHVHAPQSGALVVLALIAWLKLGRYRSSMVYTVQDSFYDYSRRNQVLMTIALAGFKRIIFCSHAAYESLPFPLKWLVRGRWDVVQNAADIDRVDRALGSRPTVKDREVFTVLSVGRLEPVKDPRALVEAFSRLDDRDARLILVGAGSIESNVAEDVRRLGMEKTVTMSGLIPRDEVFVRCAEADVFVSTSHGEGLPVSAIEAMAAGCPVILSDIPPHRELVDGAEFIPLVPIGDVDGFAREIKALRDMPAAARSELSRLSREHVVSRYTLPIMHAGIEEVYHKLPSLANDTVGAG